MPPRQPSPCPDLFLIVIALKTSHYSWLFNHSSSSSLENATASQLWPLLTKVCLNEEWVTVNWLRSCINRHIQYRKLFYFGIQWHQLRDLMSVGFKSHPVVGTSKAACGIQTHIFPYNQSVLKQMEDTCLKSPRVVWKRSYCARCTAFSKKIASSSCFGKSNGTVGKDPHWGLDPSSFSKIGRNMARVLCLHC